MTSPRIALVTGGAQGIGLAVAEALAAQGLRIALADRNAKALDEAAARFAPGQCLPLQGDLQDLQTPARWQREVRAHWGEVAVLVNNAGVPSSKREGLAAGLLELTDEEWAGVLDTNLGSAFRMSRQFVGAMAQAGWGRVAYLASDLAGFVNGAVLDANGGVFMG